jgi:ELWxxDGT repeat protein
MTTRGIGPSSYVLPVLAFVSGWLAASRADGNEVPTPGPFLLRDINTWGIAYVGTPRFELGAIFEAGSRSYFAADDGLHGIELWTTDGSRAGTRLLKDVKRGAEGSFPGGFAAAGGRVCFTASDDASGEELWTTDGTEEGTHPVRDIRPGPLGSSPEAFAVLNGRFYYTAQDGEHGRELWESDGATANLVLDISPGDTPGVSVEGVVFRGKMYFPAYHPEYGLDLWESDGTGPGTRMVKDFDGGATALLVLEDRLCPDDLPCSIHPPCL